MTLNDLREKKICILGLGMENHALLTFLLRKHLGADFTVCDSQSQSDLLARWGSYAGTVRYKTGKHYDKQLEDYDIIFRVAGYPLFTPAIIKAMMAGVQVSSPTKLFFDLCPSRRIIGVTGTKGKGTIASLVYQILKDAGERAYFGGNIGIPLFSFFEKIKPADWVVLELSSFQIEDLNVSPHIAVITNFFPEHLASADPNNPNCHKALSAYWEAKTNIFRHQQKNDFLVAPEDLRPKFKHESVHGKIRYFTSSNLQTPLVGSHNKKNIAAAQTVARLAGIASKNIRQSVAAFKGLEHRLEFVAEHDAVQYYNDSFATTPESAITALHAFEPKRIILIAGGASKKSPFALLAREIKQRVKQVILLPGTGSREIKQSLSAKKYASSISVASMREAVTKAKKNARPGDVVLLAPACASFGIFKNYKDRGEQFKKSIFQQGR